MRQVLIFNYVLLNLVVFYLADLTHLLHILVLKLLGLRELLVAVVTSSRSKALKMTSILILLNIWHISIHLICLNKSIMTTHLRLLLNRWCLFHLDILFYFLIRLGFGGVMNLL